MSKKNEKVFELPKKSLIKHFERCNNRYGNCPPVIHHSRRVYTQTLTYDETVKRYIRKSEYKEVDRISEMANYRVSDFSLENLNAIGAELKPARLSGSADFLLSSLSNL